MIARQVAVIATLLVLQLLVFAYSFTSPAQWIGDISTKTSPGYYVGVVSAQWYWLHLFPPDTGGASRNVRPLPGIGFNHAPGLADFLVVNMLWTLVPNVVAFAIPLAAAASQRRRRTRIGRGLCADCGYDLRAATTHCPECGHAIDANARAALDRVISRREAVESPAPMGC